MLVVKIEFCQTVDEITQKQCSSKKFDRGYWKWLQLFYSKSFYTYFETLIESFCKLRFEKRKQKFKK